LSKKHRGELIGHALTAKLGREGDRGMGGKLFALPWDRLKCDTPRDAYIVGIPEERPVPFARLVRGPGTNPTWGCCSATGVGVSAAGREVAMNVYRFIGVIGFATGAIALTLALGSDSDAGLWLPDAIVAQLRGEYFQNFLGGIGAVASGFYLIFFGNS
jgi:hypothetical protein